MKIMIRFFALFFILVVSIAALGQVVKDSAIAVDEVEQHIKAFHHKSMPRFLQGALLLASPIVHWSERYDIDPLLTSTIVSMESSFVPAARGKLGEVGLMQIHWYKAKRGFDLSIPSEQIHAGVKHLRYCFDVCDQDLGRALTAYATGGCDKTYKGLRGRLKRYRANVYEFRAWNAEVLMKKIDVAIWRARR